MCTERLRKEDRYGQQDSHLPFRSQYLDFASCLFPEQKVFRHGFVAMELFDCGVVDFHRCDFFVVD
jgi:hypothetical protein